MLEHFAEELRLARAATGMSQTALAEALSYSGALVAKVETSERRPSLDFARRCDAVFAADGRFERIQRRISREAVVPWFRDWAGIEQETTALRWFEPLYVPGLVQTEGYARAILAGAGLFAADEVEQQVTARLDRQGLLTRDRPPLLSVRRRRVRAAPPLSAGRSDGRAVAAPREAWFGPAPGPNPGRAAVGRCVRWARWSFRDRHPSHR